MISSGTLDQENAALLFFSFKSGVSTSVPLYVFNSNIGSGTNKVIVFSVVCFLPDLSMYSI